MDIGRGDRRFTRFMWDHIAYDIRSEFMYENIMNASQFHDDVAGGDRRKSFWMNGEWVAAMWSGWWSGEECRTRTFGCVVRNPAELRSRYAMALWSRRMADEFFLGEPACADECVVAIPPAMERCVRHAALCGLERYGTTPDGKFEILRRDLVALRKGGMRR